MAEVVSQHAADLGLVVDDDEMALLDHGSTRCDPTASDALATRPDINRKSSGKARPVAAEGFSPQRIEGADASSS
jgi:hypothetical protein